MDNHSGQLAPTKMRDLFIGFRFYRGELGLSGLFLDNDFSNCTARQVLYACHGRAPSTVQEAFAHRRFTGRELFVAAVSSGEFQSKFAERFLESFPEKSRLVFVHIPKCAGSDLSTHLIGRFASLNTKVVDRSITSIPELHNSIKSLSLEILAADKIYIHGHTHLQTYVDWGALRYDDDVFTTIRQPTDLIISQVNYVLTRIFSDEDPIPHDTKGWREEFEIKNLNQYNDIESKRKLASKILRNRGVVPDNVICRYLGNGTSARALENIAIHNVEITNLEKYHSWLKERWGIGSFTRMNESIKYISINDFGDNDKTYLNSIISEDQIFYDTIKKRLDETGKSSLRGLEAFDEKSAGQ